MICWSLDAAIFVGRRLVVALFVTLYAAGHSNCHCCVDFVAILLRVVEREDLSFCISQMVASSDLGCLLGLHRCQFIMADAVGFWIQHGGHILFGRQCIYCVPVCTELDGLLLLFGKSEHVLFNCESSSSVA